MGKDGTHHHKITSEQGFAVGNKASKMYVADHQGMLHQYGEGISSVAQSINMAAEIAYLKNPWRYAYEEDFLENAAAHASCATLTPYWALTNAQAGAGNITNAQGGIYLLTSGATASGHGTLTWRNNANFAANLRPMMNVRLRESSATNTHMTLRWGFYKDANDYCYFEYDTAEDAEELYVVARADGGVVERETVVANVGSGATDFNLNANHYYRLDVFNSYWVAYIDEVQVGSGVAIEDDIALSPYFMANNKTNAAARGLFIDYIFISSERAL